MGRLDVITRLIADHSNEYDVVPPGYDGGLHLLLMPQTFTICVAPGKSVNQLRLFSGSHRAAAIRRSQLRHYGTPSWYVLRDGSETDCDPHYPSKKVGLTDDPLLFDLTVDLSDPREGYVFKAKAKVDVPIDLSKRKHYPPGDSFERVRVQDRQGPDCSVVLEQGNFYIMKSRERLYIPTDVAVEVVAISERIGDIRIHYAGFAHPGFGRVLKKPRSPGERIGTPLIFEVRATDMPTKLYDRSILARIQLFRMSERAKDPEASDYSEQELTLSKVFADWSEKESSSGPTTTEPQ